MIYLRNVAVMQLMVRSSASTLVIFADIRIKKISLECIFGINLTQEQGQFSVRPCPNFKDETLLFVALTKMVLLIVLIRDKFVILCRFSNNHSGMNLHEQSLRNEFVRTKITDQDHICRFTTHPRTYLKPGLLLNIPSVT